MDLNFFFKKKNDLDYMHKQKVAKKKKLMKLNSQSNAKG
jgi:hypothetical protein